MIGGGRRRDGALRSVGHARERARRRVPRLVQEYLEGGADASSTLRANEDAFGEVALLPRPAVRTRDRGLRRSLLGVDLSMPVILAPAGFLRVVHPGGEVAAANAAARAGVAVTVSTLASSSVEQVACSGAQMLYQVYGAGGRRGMEQAVERAAAAGCRALVVTLDLPVPSVVEGRPARAYWYQRIGSTRSRARPRGAGSGATGAVPVPEGTPSTDGASEVITESDRSSSRNLT